MLSQTAFASKLLTPCVFGLALLFGQPASAQHVGHSQLASARQSFARSQDKVRSLRSKHSSSVQAYRQTGSQRWLKLASKQQNRLQTAKIEKMQAKARYQRLLGIQAKEAGKPAQAHKHNSVSQKLYKQAKAMERSLVGAGQRVPRAAAKKPVAKKTSESQMPASKEQAQTARSEGPYEVDPAMVPKAQPAAIKGIASRQGKKQIETALRNGEVQSALDILKRMEAQPSRQAGEGGKLANLHQRLGGKLANLRKRQMRNKVVDAAQKEALAAVKAGNPLRAAVMSQLLLEEHKVTRLRSADKVAAKMLRKVENAAVANAQKLIGTGNYGEARQLMVLARQIQQVQQRQPTRKMVRVQRTAHQNVINQMEKAAASGDIGSYLAARKLALQFHGEAKADGNPNPALLKANKRLYLKARKNSVKRALSDALRLVSGELGGVAVEEAESYLRYAKDTRSMLSKRGDKLPRKVNRMFAKVEKKISKTKLTQSTMHPAKKPGLGRRLWNATFSIKGKHRYMPQAPTSIEDFRMKYQIEDMARQQGVSVKEMRQMIRQEQEQQLSQQQEQVNQLAAEMGISPEELIQQLEQEHAQPPSPAGPVPGAQPVRVNPDYNSGPGFGFTNNGGGFANGNGGGFGGFSR